MTVVHLLKSGFAVYSVSIFFLLGCSKEAPPPITWTGEFIRFGTTYSNLPCGETLTDLNKITGELYSIFLPLNITPEPVTYYWIESSRWQDIVPESCEKATGCSDGRTVYSKESNHYHEVVHAVLSSLGKKHFLFEEGMATAFSQQDISIIGEYRTCPVTTMTSGTCTRARENIEKALDHTIDRMTLDYRVAAHFVLYLKARFGRDALFSIYQSMERDADRKTVESTFENITGIELSTVLDDWQDSSSQCYEFLNKCTHPQIIKEENSATWIYDDVMSCVNEDANGPDVRYIYLNRNIEIPVSATYQVNISSEQQYDIEVRIESCHGCPGFEKGLLEYSPGTFELYLEQGTYLLWVRNGTSNKTPIIDLDIPFSIELNQLN